MRLIPIALFLASASALPISPRLINISPEISPKIDLSSPVAQCVGIALCNPVTVKGGSQSPTPSIQQQEAPPQQTPSEGGGSLINIAPAISPDINLPGLLKCVGIANCNPVTVNKGEGGS
ncbi:hypothetical protein ColTof4_07247 [Colletotrichum tofieldiae]|uniref:Hydrophobin n=1 Tax=Colletotrichum tofieldiae TaxID=708197 RepID=A0A166UAZ1_9PEZI|nr:hypothetical protein CT0861_01477 [Colletotrichum tofieldiae]GKT74824.1 hypothetical protein ColTof4_07247 [Colletotrichum tofieldiae]